MKKHYRHSTGIVIIGLLAATIVLGGCGGSYNAEKLYWHTGRKYKTVLQDPAGAAKKDFDEAVIAIRQVIARYPGWRSSSGLQLRLGTMYAVRNETAQAEEEFKKVYVNFPERHELCAQAMFFIGQLHERRGDWENAVKQYRQLIDRYPGTVTGLQAPLYIAGYFGKLGKSAERDQAYEQAVRNYNNLIEMNPFHQNVTVLQYMLVTAYASQNRWQDAVAYLENFVQKHGKSSAAPLALYRAALIQRVMLRDTERAQVTLRRIISEYPQSKLDKKALMEVGSLSILRGDMAQAQADFNKALEQYPDDESLGAVAQLSLAAGYEKAEKWNEAEREYTNVMNNYRNTLESLQPPVLIAMHYQRMNMSAEADKALDKALAYYKDVIARKPGKNLEAAACEYIAGVYSARQQWKESLATLQMLRNKYPDDRRAALALIRMGLMYRDGLRDTAKAKEMFRQFLREYPEHEMAKQVAILLEQS